MNTSYETDPSDPIVQPRGYSPFWPLAILTIGLVLWSGYQAWNAFAQRTALSQSLTAAQPTIAEAEEAHARLYAMVQDLIQTSARDTYAAQIAREEHIPLNNESAPAGQTNP